MGKQIIFRTVLLIGYLSFCTLSFSNTVNPVSWKNGKGTAEKPYLIESAEHLYYLSKQVQAGENYLGIFFLLTTNIDLQGNSKNQWIPIGNNSSPFKGHFNGNNFEIINLYIDNSLLDYVGLFGYIHSGLVERLGISALAYLSGKDNVGGIVGYQMGGTISNCYNKSTVKGNNNVGGIVGYQYQTTVSICYNIGNIEGRRHIGGLVGMGYGKTIISNCYNMGMISASNYKGGIAGKIDGYNQKAIVSNCYQESVFDKIGILGLGVAMESIQCYYAEVGGMTPCPYGTALTHEEMQSESFFVILDNKQKIWLRDEPQYVNSRYPVLLSMKYEGLFTNEAIDISQKKTSLQASFVGNDKLNMQKGFEYKAENAEEFTRVMVEDDLFSFDLQDLTAGTKYMFRAFVETDKGIIWGRYVEFRTLLEKCGPNCGHHHHDHEEHRVIKQ